MLHGLWKFKISKGKKAKNAEDKYFIYPQKGKMKDKKEGKSGFWFSY